MNAKQAGTQGIFATARLQTSTHPLDLVGCVDSLQLPGQRCHPATAGAVRRRHGPHRRLKAHGLVVPGAGATRLGAVACVVAGTVARAPTDTAAQVAEGEHGCGGRGGGVGWGPTATLACAGEGGGPVAASGTVGGWFGVRQQVGVVLVDQQLIVEVRVPVVGHGARCRRAADGGAACSQSRQRKRENELTCISYYQHSLRKRLPANPVQVPRNPGAKPPTWLQPPARCAPFCFGSCCDCRGRRRGAG